MRRLMSVTILVGVFSILSGDTIPGGDVSGTWYAANSPYYVTGNITVQGGNSLQVEPAVEVIFLGDYDFTISGFLDASGTQNDSICFTAEDTITGWSGLYFDTSPDTSYLDYGIIEYTNYGITCDTSSPVITNTSFRKNYTGLTTGYGSPYLEYCEFRNNNQGIYVQGFDYTTLFSCKIENNLQGIVHTGFGTPGMELMNCEIRSNTDHGIIFNGAAYIIMDACTLSNNSSDEHGGGMLVSGLDSVIITNCLFDSNTTNVYSPGPSIDGGGAIFTENITNLWIIGCTFIDNRADSAYGAAVCGNNATISIDSCTFGNNSGYWNGALAVDNCNGFQISNSILQYNSNPYEKGSGAHISSSDSHSITYCVFSKNDGPNVLSVSYSQNATVSNCTFSGNQNTSIHVQSGNSNIDFINTIVEGSSGYGMDIMDSTGILISYSDFYNNSSGNFTGEIPSGLGFLDTTNYNNDSCDVYFNIFMDPMFEDTANGNYHLTLASPCIDAGDPAYPKDPDSTFTEIGAYWFDQTGVVEYPVIKHIKENNSLGATIFSGPLQLPEGLEYIVLDITGRVFQPDEITRGIYFIEVDGKIEGKVIKVR